MEHRRFGTMAGCIVALGLLLSPARALPDEAEHHEGAHTSGASHAETKSLGELWRGVKAHETELQRLVQAKDLGKVHETAFALRDLVAAMPDKSTLPPEQLVKLKGNAKYVATIAARLDSAGDANDQAATESSLKQLQSVLTAIEALYPEGVLK